MTSKAVTVPLPENLPFINNWFIRSAQKVEDDRHEMDAAAWPGMIGDDLIESLKKFSPETFTAFLGALRPTVEGELILSHKDLEDVTLFKGEPYHVYFAEEGDFDDFTDDQLQIWLLYSASFPKDIDWRKVATLYNDSPVDQRHAINDFLWEFRRLEIHSLLEQKGLDLSLPESLSSNKSRSVDGDEQLFCEMTQQWLRDDVFHSKFKVSLAQGFSDSDFVAYAGTLNQAIAKAIVIAQRNDGVVAWNTQKAPDGKVGIHYEDRIVATANLTRIYEPQDDASLMSCRGILTWGEKRPGPISEQCFRKALWSTEKLFGLQWSKVRHLEDDLGM